MSILALNFGFAQIALKLFKFINFMSRRVTVVNCVLLKELMGFICRILLLVWHYVQSASDFFSAVHVLLSWFYPDRIWIKIYKI